MVRRVFLLTASGVALLASCTAELKEENNRLLDSIEAQERELARLESENGALRLQVDDYAADLERRELAAQLGMAAGERLHAQLATSLGLIECELLPAAAPKTVANFVGLAEGTKAWRDPDTREMKVGVPFYDGTIFHRVIPEFMIQGGDRTGTGHGGPGFSIDDEFNDKHRHEAGVLSMANTGKPHTGGSQFFVTERAAPQLDGKHTVFGTCTPVSLVAEIARVDRGPDDLPDDPIVLRTVRIIRSGVRR